MNGTVVSGAWLAVLLALAGLHFPALAVACSLLVWAWRDTGCQGRHRLQSATSWRRGRWLQTRWRCVACGQRFGWGSLGDSTPEPG